MGAYMDLPNIPLLPRPQLRTRLGYKVQLAETENTSYLLSSAPLELGVRFAQRCQTYNHLGCGLFVEFASVTHLAAQYDLQGTPDRHQVFDSPLGLNIKVGWYFINLGYSSLTY